MNPGKITQQTRRLARNVKWLAMQELLIRLLGLATAIYLARVLSPAAYGSLGLALAIIGILETLVQAGTGSRATRLTALHPGSVPLIHAQTTGLRIVFVMGVLAALYLCVPLLTTVLDLSAPLLVLCSLLLLRPALSVAWAFRGLDQMQVVALSSVAEKTLLFAGLVVLVDGVGNDLLWAPVIETAAALGVIFWMRKRLGVMYPGLSVSFRPSEWPEIWRESMPLGVATLLGSIYIHGVILLLGWLGTAASTADFLLAQKLMLTMLILLEVINNSAFPAASRLSSSGAPQALELVSRLLRYYLVLIIPVIFVLALFAHDILALLFGHKYTNAGPVLIVLLLALPFLAVNQSLLLLLRAIPKPATILTGRSASTVVLLAAAGLLIPSFGAIGAAAALVISEAMGMLLLFWLAQRVTTTAPLNTRSLAPLLAGAVATAVFMLADGWPLTFALVLAACVYVLALWSLQAVSAAELRSIPHVILAALREDRGPQTPR